MSRISGSTQASNQFKIIVIGLPDAGSTHLIDRLLNKRPTQQTKILTVYNCIINAKTLQWREVASGYQPPAKDKSCIRAVIFEVIATKTIIDLLYLLIAPEDIVLLAYNPLSINDTNYMADIDYILNYISAHCHTKLCSSAINCPHFPVVLMVGIQSTASLNSRTTNFLREYCQGKTYEKHIHAKAFYFIDDYRIIHQVNFLKEVILDTAKPLYSQDCPIAYLQFEKKILELSRKQYLLNVANAFEIGNEFGIQTTEQLFEHFRNKGIILYYPKIKVLENKLFISPKTLMRLITNVFVLPDYSFLHETLAKRPDMLELVVNLLKSFDLAVHGHWSISQPSKVCFDCDNNPFIIPSIEARNNDAEKLKPKDHVGVSYHFLDRFLPRCLFYQLLTKLINWLHSDGDTIYCIEISREVFKLESKQIHKFELQLNNAGIINCYIKIPPAEETIKESLYSNLLDFIQKALIELCDCCIPSARKPVCYLECPFDHDDKGPHLLLNEIWSENCIICRITNTPVPKPYYAPLLRSNSTDEEFVDVEYQKYALALKEGKAKPSSIRILIVGAENSGKTCLVESLLGGKFQSNNDATQGADMSVCKFFTTNWSRLHGKEVSEKLQKDFCAKWKAASEQSMSPTQDYQIGSSSAVCSSSLESFIPTSITVTSTETESPPVQSDFNRRLSLPLEELPRVSMEDLKEAKLSLPICKDEMNAVIWDVSGQTVYHGLLPAFLTEDNAVIVTFDASRDLYSFTKGREDSLTENSVNRKMTSCQVVCYWCKAIYSICRKRSSTHDSLSRFWPTIFLVATHIDKIGDSHEVEERKSAIIGLLAAQLKGKPFARLLAGNIGSNGIETALKKYCFFVSNLRRNQDVFCQLKTAIVESCQHIINQDQPMAYLYIEKKIAESS